MQGVPYAGTAVSYTETDIWLAGEQVHNLGPNHRTRPMQVDAGSTSIYADPRPESNPAFHNQLQQYTHYATRSLIS